MAAPGEYERLGVGAADLAACPLPPLLALAASPGAPVALTWRGAAPASDGAASLRCTLRGAALRFACGALEVPLGATSRHVIAAQPGLEGAALLHRSDAAGSLDAGPPRVLLLTPDARIAAEVQAYAEMDGGASVRAVLEADVYALGEVLGSSACDVPTAVHAAAAAMARGWRAAARRLLCALVAGGACPEAMLLPGGVSLLHVAASTGAAWAVRAVLDAPASAAAADTWSHLARMLRGPQRDAAWLLGSPLQRCGSEANASTPMAAAAAALALAVSTSGHGPVVDDALAALEALAVSPEGAAAWLGVACGTEAGGATPASLALGAMADAQASSPAAMRLRALDAAARRRVAAGARVAAAACDELRSRCGVFFPSELGAFAPAMLAAMDTAAVEADAVAVAFALLRCAADAAGVTVERDLASLGEKLPAFPRAAAAGMRLRRLLRLALAPEAADNISGDVSAAAEAALPEELRCYTAWLLQRSRWLTRFWAANMFWYYARAVSHAGGLSAHVARLAAEARHAEGDELHIRSWPAAEPLYWALVATWQLLALQLPLILALLWELTPPELLRPRLPQPLRAVTRQMGFHHAVHYLLAGAIDARMLVATSPAAVARVVFPVRAGAVFAAATLLSHMGLPLRARVALPLLALRAALPLAAHAGAPVWLHTPRAGVALQLAGVALAALLVLWRDAVLRPAFRAARAAALAEAAAMAKGQQTRKEQ